MPQNVLERLAKSAKNNHGLELFPTQVKEIVTIMQGMQYQIASDQGRTDALTRILAITLNQLGGSLDVHPDLFAEAEDYAIEVNWDDDEDVTEGIIHVSLIRNMGLPEVQEDGDTTSRADSSAVPVSDDQAGGGPPHWEDGPDDTIGEE